MADALSEVLGCCGERVRFEPCSASKPHEVVCPALAAGALVPAHGNREPVGVVGPEEEGEALA